MSNAPFCNVKGVTVPGIPSLAPIQPVPVATDLASALAAIQALRNNFHVLYNTLTAPPRNTLNGTASSSPGPTPQLKTGSPKNGRWQEVPGSRLVQRVEVPVNSEKDTVTIERINGYTMRDSITGELFVWKR